MGTSVVVLSNALVEMLGMHILVLGTQWSGTRIAHQTHKGSPMPSWGHSPCLLSPQSFLCKDKQAVKHMVMRPASDAEGQTIKRHPPQSQLPVANRQMLCLLGSPLRYQDYPLLMIPRGVVHSINGSIAQSRQRSRRYAALKS